MAQETITSDEVIACFNNYLDSIPFYSKVSIDQETKIISEHITNLQNWKDKEAYISKNRLNTYIKSTQDSLIVFGSIR